MSGWKVILRSKAKNQLVLYNGEEVLVKGDTSKRERLEATALNHNHKLDYCATCRRPFTNEQAFMDSDYFEFLQKIHISEIKDNAGHNISMTCLNQGYYKKFFLEEQQIGRGYRGTVFRCKHHLDNIILGEYAIKKVPVGDDESWLVKTLKEVKGLERLHHPNIVLYKHAWLEIHQLTRFGPAIPCLFILMEYADRGNLDDYIQDGLLKESEILPIFSDLLNGLSYLHDMGIIHRDLKPQNLLLYGRDRM